MVVSAVCTPPPPPHLVTSHNAGCSCADLNGKIRRAYDSTIQQFTYLYEKALYKDDEPEYAQSVCRVRIDQTLNQQLLEICDCLLANNTSHIIIRACDANGFGDLLFAIKLRNMLSENIPNCKIAIVCEDQVTIDKMASVSETQDVYLLKDLPEEYKRTQTGLCIGAAVFFAESTQELKYEEMGLAS